MTNSIHSLINMLNRIWTISHIKTNSIMSKRLRIRIYQCKCQSRLIMPWILHSVWTCARVAFSTRPRSRIRITWSASLSRITFHMLVDWPTCAWRAPCYWDSAARRLRRSSSTCLPKKLKSLSLGPQYNQEDKRALMLQQTCKKIKLNKNSKIQCKVALGRHTRQNHK